MSPRLFAAVIGGIMVVIGLIALGSTITVADGSDTVECGSGFAGLSDTPGLRDAGHDVAAAGYPMFAGDPSDLEGECKDAIGTRRAWGWPVFGIGAVAVLGGLLVRQPGPRQPASGASDATPAEQP